MMCAFRRRKLYRSRSGIVFGVCQGIADWRELPVGMVRLVSGIIILTTGMFPGGLVYLGLAIFLPVEPNGQDRYSPGGGVGGGDRDDDFTRRDREREWDKKFYDSRR